MQYNVQRTLCRNVTIYCSDYLIKHELGTLETEQTALARVNVLSVESKECPGDTTTCAEAQKEAKANNAELGIQIAFTK